MVRLTPTLLLLAGVSWAAVEDGLATWWSFDEGTAGATSEKISGQRDAIQGLHRYVSGVSGRALRLDGATTAVIHPATRGPQLGDSFSIEAWVALQAYPWSWCAIVDQSQDELTGYYFGIDPEGRFGLHLAVDNNWQTTGSTVKLALYKWHHLVGTYSPAQGVRLYLNGQNVGTWPIQGRPTFAADAELQIGRNRKPKVLAHAVRQPLPTPFSLDGIIDEVRIYNRALSGEEAQRRYAGSKPAGPDPLSVPVLPSGPKGPGPFGAYYTRLRYTQEWEAPWRVGEHADVVVRFDGAPYRFVFWRGTRYIPCWVTENGIWYTNEFFETWSSDMKTGGEPMADRQTRFSHVRVLESSEARAVVHWRYAPVELGYGIPHADPDTGWGDWVDEYYVLYPDGSGVRKIRVWSSASKQVTGRLYREFHESIVVNPPGTRPEDNIETDGLTLANMNGESFTYSWAGGVPGTAATLDPEVLRHLRRTFPNAEKRTAWLVKPPRANIHVVNLKAKYRPYVIVTPVGTVFDSYAGEIKRERSIYPWWNHWPVADLDSTGRWAVTPERASSSSLSHVYWPPVEENDEGLTKLMLHGMTDKPAASLVPLAKSWLAPPPLDVRNGNAVYEAAQRAYLVTRNGQERRLVCTLRASPDAPAVNPVLVIKNWGEPRAGLTIDGRQARHHQDFRVGPSAGLEGSDLVIWIGMEATRPTELVIER